VNIPVEFVIFGVTLLGVAIFHRHALAVALLGLAAVTACKVLYLGFDGQTGLLGLQWHLLEEWVILVNLFALLVGFALMARHFETSQLPRLVPGVLPDGWKGGLALLAMVFVLSTVLDNIAAALIGATVAGTIFRSKLHIGYLAAIVAASNAGGSGSVIGDTTTTLMWLDGVSPPHVVHAYVGAIVAFFVFAIPASRQQQRYSPLERETGGIIQVDWARVIIAGLILVSAVAVNIHVNREPSGEAAAFPYVGATVIGVILLLTPWRRPDWTVIPRAAKGGVFLLSLMMLASMMPVDRLPMATAQTTFGLGFVSAVFDDIPLTMLALEQGGYDWGVLAYAVGFGGSMIWFGSSAGVAVSNLHPEAGSAIRWLRGGWHIVLAYVAGFSVLIAFFGWHPPPPHAG
jgi:Na+/H+ antiporter NhaD/arsenite permease-like protein